jgi:hypothetical protein
MDLQTVRKAEYVLLGIFTVIFLWYGLEALMIGDTFRFTVVLLPSLALSLLPIAFEYAMKVRFPPGVKALVSLALLLHVAGGISRFYWKFAPFYDKLAHVVSALALFLLVICCYVVLDHLGSAVRWRTILTYAVVFTTIFMVSWEISEYLIDVVANSSYNNGIVDSIGDLIANGIGIIVGILLARYYRSLVPPGKNPGYLLNM